MFSMTVVQAKHIGSLLHQVCQSHCPATPSTLLGQPCFYNVSLTRDRHWNGGKGGCVFNYTCSSGNTVAINLLTRLGIFFPNTNSTPTTSIDSYCQIRHLQASQRKILLGFSSANDQVRTFTTCDPASMCGGSGSSHVSLLIVSLMFSVCIRP
jgi:hypothetical protein